MFSSIDSWRCDRAAAMYSLIGSARLNGIDPDRAFRPRSHARKSPVRRWYSSISIPVRSIMNRVTEYDRSYTQCREIARTKAARCYIYRRPILWGPAETPAAQPAQCFAVTARPPESLGYALGDLSQPARQPETSRVELSALPPAGLSPAVSEFRS